MHDRVKIDAELVRSRIEALKVSYPDLVEDAELLASTVEGETDFHRVLDRVLDAFLDTVSMKASIADRMASLKERGERFDRKAEALKGLAHGMMEAAEQRKIILPQATLSIMAGRKRVVVDDVDALPQGMFRTERVALKDEIASSLHAEGAVPGAHLEIGPPTLSIRTK
jgi:uncharacterized protein YdcH (DUF465 family)